MAIDQEKNYKLLSDEPVLESGRADRLEFEHTAKVLARAALHADSPITIGIYGGWGSGKTSLMRLMWQCVEEEGLGARPAVAVWFNAWQYEREEHLVVPLIATIARDIKNKQMQWKKKKGKAARDASKIMDTGGSKIHDALRSVLYGVSIVGKFGIPHVGELEISASMKDMIERYEAVTKDTLMARSLYFDAFDKLRELAHDKKVEKPQIVVFIDDLDRCFPEHAVRLIESIKLILHQPSFAFVLGIYPQIIEEFIRNKYAAQYSLAAAQVAAKDLSDLQSRMDKYLGYFDDYLEKIVQVHHYVPERGPSQMQSYIKQLLEEAEVTSEFLVEGVKEEDLFELIAEVGKRSPREIIRKMNSLIVKWRISKGEKKTGQAYDLLAGLINEAIQDRVAKGRNEYEQFLHRLEWHVEDEKSPTYGAALAKALKKCHGATYHDDKIDKLKKLLKAESSPTMQSLVELMAADIHLCNVLNSPPGLRWLSDRKYREEMRETYKEKQVIAEEQESIDVVEEPIKTRKRAKPPDESESIIKLFDIVDIPAGEFDMGSEDGDHEKPVHKVKLASFKMSATPVTQAQYERVMGVNPSHFKGKEMGVTPEHPVESVSWNDAMVFCERLTKLLKGSYKVTLPSEAQWEYACRAGTKTPFNTGDNLTTDQANYDGNYPYKNNPKGKFIGKTTPVRTYPPNDWDLYDMHGNVWEWCLDKWHDNYEGAPTNGSAWEAGDGSYRVLRGGSWSSYAQYCRSAIRIADAPGNRGHDVGFRLVFVPQSVGSPS